MDRSVFSAVIGFFIGILWYSFASLGFGAILYLLLISATCLALFVYKKQAVFLCASALLCGVGIGAARVAVLPDTLPDSFQHMVGREVVLEGVVAEDPDIRERTQRLTIAVTEGEAHMRFLAVVPLYPAVSYGEQVRVSGVLSYPQSFETSEGRIFHYDTFLKKDGVYAVMQNASVEQVGTRTGFFTSMRGVLSDFKFDGLRALSYALPEPHASLAGGLILGGKQGLGSELLDAFITSGLVHIVVLSGYNVMILAEAVFRAGSVLSKQWAALCAGVTILSFVLAAGAGAASVRAGIMAVIALYARATGRTYEAFRALIAAGVLMLLWNPLLLAYDPGFQLSFIATLGLIFGAPITERWVSFIAIPFLREITASTIAAQIAVLPLLLYQNGLLSLVALPANILVLPLVPLAMALSALAGVAGFIVPTMAPLFGYPAYLVLSYIIGVVEGVAELPFAAISIPAFPYMFVFLAYLILFSFVFHETKKQGRLA